MALQARVILLAIAALLATSRSSFAAGDKTIVVQVTPTWSIVIPSSFETLPHADSWQAHDPHRVIYVSSLIVDGGATPVDELAATGEEWLTGMVREKRVGKGEPKSERRSGAVRGHAVTLAGDHGPMLLGYMATKGGMVVCLINFDDVGYRAWAFDTWRSLQAR